MNVIYEPKGKAREYSGLAVNLYRGCGHRCKYCYAPGALWMNKNKEEFFENPQPRTDVLKKIEKDAKKLAGDPRPILLCFTCDPYQPIERECRLTRETIKILHQNELSVRILTKAGALATRDFDLLSARPDLSEFGVTLVFSNGSNGWEKRTASEIERINTLETAKSLGIPTWVSLEPVFDPEQTLNLIRMSHHCTDRYAVGKLNYRSLEKKFDLKVFREDVIGLLQDLGKEYTIKKDLAEAE
jgi:DNA repair photolyase